jgi:hypothetical protein
MAAPPREVRSASKPDIEAGGESATEQTSDNTGYPEKWLPLLAAPQCATF